jgi:hypothetical protein
LQSEYGWTHEYVLYHVTPAQVLVWAEAIRRRRSLHLAEELELTYLAVGAAQGGKKGFSALQAATRRLRREGGAEEERDPEQLIRALGLTDRRGR